ncbi:MAG TPA: DUF192 domain-containing protein, partial [Zeimonas sp.]|nr:DUF192 domain-containing protein [Zeimonas sp.]
MRRIVSFLVLVLACTVPVGPHGGPFAQAASMRWPQPKLPTVRIEAGMHVIRAELADTGRTREIGLMGRASLGPNEGMLFVFERKGVHCF